MGISQQIGASSIIKPGVIDSAAARPASPYTGQVIYETDTSRTLTWNGTAWYANWNTSWGLQNLVKVSTTDTTIASEEVQITGGSFTAVANRYYKVTYFEPQFYGSSYFMTGKIRFTNISGTVLTFAYVDIFNTGREGHLNLQWVGTLSAGTTNFVATADSYLSTGQAIRSSTNPAFLLVEDIGPA